ncbi:MAG: ABC transporter permease [Spirochaetes bacterium]|nr:ABC transporter permease [Spirochaetota bacterium]
MTARIAFRNLVRQKRRYGLLFAAIALGFAVVTLLGGMSGGMTVSLRRKAKSYYGGDITILGHNRPDYFLTVPDFPAIRNAVMELGVADLVVPRGNVYSGGSVFFGGAMIRQKRITGTDFAVEWPRFATMDFVEGRPDGLAENGGIILSEATANRLGAKVGDEIMVLLTSFGGQKNTGVFILRGIFRDNSLFGFYTAYCDIGQLTTLTLHPTGITDVGVWLKPGIDPAAAAEKVRAVMEREGLLVFPVIHRKDVYDLYKAKRDWTGVKYAILTLDAHLYEVKDFLDAIRAVTYFLLGVFVIIVTVGISNTYRVVVFERTREIGTMRAIGIQRPAVRAIFLYEALGLGIAGSIAGFALGLAALSIVAGIDLSGVPGFQMFLERNRLRWDLEPAIVALDAVIVCLAAVVAAWRPASSAASIEPADALRS